jgi:hypothetical protein
MNTITFDKALDVVEELPVSQQEELIDILKKRLIDRRRREIARAARETMRAVKEGKAKNGTVEDLRRDLLK